MPDLCTPTDVILALAAGGRSATPDQLAALPAAVSAASGLAVLACGGRDFARKVYDETYEPAQDGRIWLRQMPVNFVVRAASGRSAAITIQCSLAVARASVAMTPGTLATDPPPGITLASVASGATTSTPIAFTGLASISALATAVNAVSGWTATVPTWAAGLPCSDLVDNLVAAPATGPGADLAAFADDVPGRLDARAGILEVATDRLRSSGSSADPSWWPTTGGAPDDRVRPDRVRVIYDAGFDAVPPPVVQGTALIAIMLLDKYGADNTVLSESLGNTTFSSVSPELLAAIPRTAMGYLLPYRIMRA